MLTFPLSHGGTACWGWKCDLAEHSRPAGEWDRACHCLLVASRPRRRAVGLGKGECPVKND